ncbi:MAG: hypothetical protein HQK54_00875, partial [Oligoflexales bacterium]|nr:hypothetical protein [Oligoflexales bacterium]
MHRADMIRAIFVCLGIGIIIFISLISFKSTKNKRKSDKTPLKGHQKRVYSQIQKLLSEGKPKAAGQLLESVGLFREAISLYERENMIKEAAAVLLRIHRPNRAAVIYTQHRMWENAADCYELAKMPLEVAKCSKEYGNLTRAAANFIKAKKFTEAADCYEEAGDLLHAARLYRDMGNEPKAIELYHSLLDNSTDIKLLEFSENELRFFSSHLKSGNINSRLADVLANNNRLLDIIIELIKEDRIHDASDLFLRCSENIGSKLLAIDTFTTVESERLAKLFESISNYEYAGMIFERLKDFENAGISFEKSENYQRAAYCYDRAGMKKESLNARCKAASEGDKTFEKSLEAGGADTNPFRVTDDSENATAPKEKQKGEHTNTSPRNQWENYSSIRKVNISKPSEDDASEDDTVPDRAGDTDKVDANNLENIEESNEENTLIEPKVLPVPEAAENETQEEFSKPNVIAMNINTDSKLDPSRVIFHKMDFFESLDYLQKNKIWEIAQKMNF